MALSVKAYLYFDSDEPEIRRFCVDQEVSANYTYIVQKIKSVFPSLLRKDITLFWKDKDEELITFSSDDELVDALGSVSGNIFKIYIREAANKGPNHKPETKQEEVKFPGVVCDGCESSITGVRFKCLACPDYDLCGTCEATGMHAEHAMLRIRVPGQQFPWNFRDLLRGFGVHRGHSFPGRGRCGHGRGHWRWGPFRGHGPRGGCPWMGQQTPPQSSGEQQPSASSEEGNEHPSSGQASGEVPVGPPFLHAMGEAVASFLNPFGIDVHTYTDDDNVCCEGKCDLNCCPNKEKPCKKTTAESSSASEEAKSEATAEKCKEPTDSGSPPPSETDNSEESMATDEQNDHNGYVLVDKKTEEVSTAPDTTQSNYQIEICMEHLRAMGFNTQEGWFRTLVEAKNGDISQVLDSIHPNGNQ